MTPDAQLIAQSLERPAVFEELFTRHFPAVHRYLRRRLGAELAGELASETFLQAFRSRANFDRDRPTALPWLYAIAANLVRMHHRTEERRLRAYARSAAAEQVADTASIEGVAERLDASALGPALAGALATLQPALREALLLHAWAGLSHDEIAQALGCSPGAVRVRVSRARALIEAQLDREEAIGP
jgi:RNA polymerase sigma factor (sigma-70 family)